MKEINVFIVEKKRITLTAFLCFSILSKVRLYLCCGRNKRYVVECVFYFFLLHETSVFFSASAVKNMYLIAQFAALERCTQLKNTSKENGNLI